MKGAHYETKPHKDPNFNKKKKKKKGKTENHNAKGNEVFVKTSQLTKKIKNKNRSSKKLWSSISV